MTKPTINENGVYRIPEIKIGFVKELFVDYPNAVKSSVDSVAVMRSIIDPEEIELREHMIALYLNRAGEPLGYYKLSIGGVNATVADGKIIFACAIRCLASSIILCHNHPSGLVKASEADLALTRKIKNAGELIDIQLLDHIILTKNAHLSFADEGLAGIINPYQVRPEDNIITEPKRAWSSGLAARKAIEKKSLELQKELLKI